MAGKPVLQQKETRSLRVAGAVAILALLLQVLMPLVHAPRQANAADALFADALVICSANGLVKLPGSPAGESRDILSLLQCPICAAAHHAGLGLPPMPAPCLHLQMATLSPIWPDVQSGPGASRAVAAQPRAPPSILL